MSLSQVNNERPRPWWYNDESKLRDNIWNAIEEWECCPTCYEDVRDCTCSKEWEDDDDDA